MRTRDVLGELHLPHIISEYLNFYKWGWVALVAGETGFTKSRDEKSDVDIESVCTLTPRAAAARWSPRRPQLPCGRQPSGRSQASSSVSGRPWSPSARRLWVACPPGTRRKPPKLPFAERGTPNLPGKTFYRVEPVHTPLRFSFDGFF